MSEQQHDATAVRLRYDPQPPPEEAAGALTLTFPTDAERGAAPFEATLARPGAVREALQTLGAVLDSDLRRKASDRSDYLAYLLAQGKKATKELWEAQKAFLDAQYGDEEEDAEGPLDPVLTVDERGVALEVFSADESSYARLHLKPEAFAEGQRPSGPARTTHLRLDAPAREALGRIRAYRETRLRFLPSEGGETYSGTALTYVAVPATVAVAILVEPLALLVAGRSGWRAAAGRFGRCVLRFLVGFLLWTLLLQVIDR